MSSWDTSTGLLEEFQLQVTEAWFGTNDKYNQGKTLLLNLKGPASVDGDVVDPEHLLMLSCGDKWTAAQGGAKAVNTTGSESFNNQSAMGRLIDGVKDIGADAIAVMKNRGESFEADTWNNLVMDIERRKTGDFKDRVTGEVREVYNYIPTTIAEAGSGSGSAPAAAASSGAGANKAAQVKLRIGLKQEAANHADNDAFTMHILDGYADSAAVQADEELLNEVIDGTLYAEATS